MQKAYGNAWRLFSAQHLLSTAHYYFSPTWQLHSLRHLKSVAKAFSTCFYDICTPKVSLIYPVCVEGLLRAGHCFSPGECKDLMVKGSLTSRQTDKQIRMLY